MTIEEIMNTNITAVRGSMTVKELGQLLVSEGISGVPVMDDDNKLIGVVTLKDVVIRVNKDNKEIEEYMFYRIWEDTFDLDEVESSDFDDIDARVEEIMTPTVFSVSPETSVSETAETMCRGKIHRIFVVDSNQNLVGIVSALDLVKLLVDR